MTDKLHCPFCGAELEKRDNYIPAAQALLKEIKEDYDFYELKAGEGQNIDWRVLANIFAEKITPITTQKKE